MVVLLPLEIKRTPRINNSLCLYLIITFSRYNVNVIIHKIFIKICTNCTNFFLLKFSINACSFLYAQSHRVLTGCLFITFLLIHMVRCTLAHKTHCPPDLLPMEPCPPAPIHPLINPKPINLYIRSDH